MHIKLDIQDITEENKHTKFSNALYELSKALDIPATIENTKENKEKFPFNAQEELYQSFKNRFGLIMDDLYSRICSTLGMAPISIFKKAIDPNAPTLGREILWNPETGSPITQKEIDRLLTAVDKFLNRNVGPFKKEIVLSQASIARILAKLRENNTFDALKERPLEKLQYKRKKWDSITSYKKLNTLFPDNYDRLKFRERVVGNYIQDINESTRKKIRDILDQGYLAGKSKGEISQELFYQFGSLNKDWDRIIDTEGVNIFNAEYLDEQKRDVAPGEPLYFIRREYSDNRTCSFCIQATKKPIIARWSDVPLEDDKIKDPVASIAIWPGKTNYGRSRADWRWSEGAIHVSCRGFWDRYYEEIGDLEL